MTRMPGGIVDNPRKENADPWLGEPEIDARLQAPALPSATLFSRRCDCALLKTFGAGGMGVFPVAEIVAPLVTATYRVKRIGACEGVEERSFAIFTEKKVQHPLVRGLLEEGR